MANMQSMPLYVAHTPCCATLTTATTQTTTTKATGTVCCIRALSPGAPGAFYMRTLASGPVSLVSCKQTTSKGCINHILLRFKDSSIRITPVGNLFIIFMH